MLTPFKLGLGGVIGCGRQYFSWIALDDLVCAIVFALENDSLVGPVNAVAPGAVTNREFTKTLGRVLGRPTIFPMPAFAARLAFGEMADEMLLGGVRVAPHELTAASFEFAYPELEPALRHLLEVTRSAEVTRPTPKCRARTVLARLIHAIDAIRPHWPFWAGRVNL